MLGDIVYESGRGIAPDYLMFLGASAFMVGVVSGAGEFLGYGARLITGTLSDRSKAYWVFIFAGYGFIFCLFLRLTKPVSLSCYTLQILEDLTHARKNYSPENCPQLPKAKE